MAAPTSDFDRTLYTLRQLPEPIFAAVNGIAYGGGSGLAATILSCARRPRRQATAGVISHLALVAHRIAPRATESVVARWSASLLTGPATAGPGSGSLFDPGIEPGQRG